MKEYMDFNVAQKIIQIDEKKENTEIDFSSLDYSFRREFIDALNKGAISRCETLVDVLEEGECKFWIANRLSEMDLKTIKSSIVYQH
jgi:hypothetical protein